MACRTGVLSNRSTPGLALLIFLAAAAPAETAAKTTTELRGTPEIITGDLLDLKGRHLRLDGIDAPEPGQRCSIADKLYDCGEIARSALLDLTAGVEVVCRTLGPDAAAETQTARCFAEGYDLSEGMVYTGWALALPGAPDRYVAMQERAETRRHGLWKGRFVAPWDWLKGQRLPEETAD